MADQEFTLESLAEYLHLNVAQVSRLAERGQLPGRRLGGTWRFQPAEIHHWLEARMGAADEEGLAQMESALRVADQGREEQFVSVAQWLPLSGIAIPLPAKTRNSAIDSMIELATQTGWLWDPDKMRDAVRSREELHPTAMDCGVALLHPRRPLGNILEQPFLALGRTERGVPFGNSGVLTDVFFLICSTDDRSHLRVVARLSRLLNLPGFLPELRSAPDAVAAHEVIERLERELPG